MRPLGETRLWIIASVAGITGLQAQIEVTSGGKVGVGTSLPNAQVEILSASPSTLPNLQLTSGQDRTPQIRFNGPWSVSNAGESYAQIRAVNDNGGPGAGATASLRFSTASGDPAVLTDKLAISGSGNIGIGTTAPLAPFHILGNVDREVARFQGSADTANFRTYLSLYNTNPNFWWEFSNQDAVGGGTANGLGFRERSGSGPSLTRMYLASGGNVGIGTTSPGVPLEVAGGAAYNLYLSGNAPSLYLGGTSGVAPNGAGNSSAAYISFSSFTGSYGQNVGDLNIVTQSRSTGNSSSINFMVPADDSGSYTMAARITRAGNVGIGTGSPAHKLHVAGSVRATSFIADVNTYADFVFKPGYRLAPLTEVEAHIEAHGHLPDIPSEAEAREQGIDLATMQVKLLQKIEELTLHVIALEKQSAAQRREIDHLLKHQTTR